MINNYIFDFGNVLAEFYPDRLTAPFVKDEETNKRIREVVFDRLYWNKLDSGDITDDEVKNGICSRLSQEDGEIGCLVYDNWVKSMTPVKDMEKLVKDIHSSGKKLFLLSNISEGFAKTYPQVQWIKELFDNFDGIVLSGTIRKTKPNKDIFEYLLKEFNLNPDECIFIDDSPINISGAKEVGIDGYIFDGDAQKLREFLGL